MSVFTDTVDRDFISFFLGEKLGSGIARQVYAHGFDDRKVIKVEVGAGSFQNIEEWNTWKEIQHTKWAKYFAPCEAISACGTILIQRRTKPLTNKPKVLLPDFLCDFKVQNYGKIGSQVVCHDYGMNLMRLSGRVKMKQPEWWWGGE